MKRLVLDFDHTLFDAARIWEHWLNVLEDHGADRHEAQDRGQELFRQGFTPRRHAEVLGLNGAELDELESMYEHHLEMEAPALVYKDVFPFLEPRQEDVTILTHGHPDFQHLKLEQTGIADVVDEIRISTLTRLKTIHLKELADMYEELVFVDDNPRMLLAASELNLPLDLYRMTRKNARHTDHSHEQDGETWRVIHSLDELPY